MFVRNMTGGGRCILKILMCRVGRTTSPSASGCSVMACLRSSESVRPIVPQYGQANDCWWWLFSDSSPPKYRSKIEWTMQKNKPYILLLFQIIFKSQNRTLVVGDNYRNNRQSEEPPRMKSYQTRCAVEDTASGAQQGGASIVFRHHSTRCTGRSHSRQDTGSAFRRYCACDTCYNKPLEI